MKTIIKAVAIIAGLLIAGCASPISEQANLVKDSDENMVKGCDYLGDVNGTSGFGGLASTQGMINAKNEAKDKAAKLNATHIVWNSVAGGYSPSAYGRAYDCNSKVFATTP